MDDWKAKAEAKGIKLREMAREDLSQIVVWSALQLDMDAVVSRGLGGYILRTLTRGIAVNTFRYGWTLTKANYEELFFLALELHLLRNESPLKPPWRSPENLRRVIQRWRERASKAWKTISTPYEGETFSVQFAIDTSTAPGSVLFRVSVRDSTGAQVIADPPPVAQEMHFAELFLLPLERTTFSASLFGQLYARTMATCFRTLLFREPLLVFQDFETILDCPEINGRRWSGKLLWGDGDVRDVVSGSSFSHFYETPGMRTITVVVEEPPELARTYALPVHVREAEVLEGPDGTTRQKHPLDAYCLGNYLRFPEPPKTNAS